MKKIKIQIKQIKIDNRTGKANLDFLHTKPKR